MFHYYNANPFDRRVDDCAVRAISLAENESWDDTYKKLSEYARRQGITLSEVSFINEYLADRYERYCPKEKIITLQDFIDLDKPGVWLVTMNGHITCVKDGVIYDTFDCSDRTIWCIYRVR